MTIQEHLAAGHIPYSNGVEVKQLTVFEVNETDTDFPVFGVVAGEIYSWNLEGSLTGGSANQLDLTWKPKEVTLWVNIAKDATMYAHHSEKDAIELAYNSKEAFQAVAVPLTFTPKI